MDRPIRNVPARQGYDLWASSYDSTPNPVVAMDARHFMRTLGPSPGDLILDAGCGTGRNLAALVEAGARPIGIDFSLDMLKVARARMPSAALVAVDLELPLPFRDGLFDATCCSLVGEHLRDLPLTLTELHRVTRAGGRLVFSVFHPDMAAAGIEANFERDGVEYRLGAIMYSLTDYLTLIERAGFRDVTCEEFESDEAIAALAPGASRWVGKRVLLVLDATR